MVRLPAPTEETGANDGPRLRSPLARAVVPVLGGMAVLALIFLATWGIAALISRGDAESSERLAPTEFELGPVEPLAETIVEGGPLILPDLNTASGTRTLVVDHEGDDPSRGWIVYWGYRRGDDPSCEVELIEGTRSFVNCRGDELDITDLAPPEGVRPRVENQTTLWIDLRAE